MNIHELLEQLADDPFDNDLRAQLATLYASDGKWQKAHKQWVLIKKQRALNADESKQLIDCLQALGFDDEADMLLNKLDITQGQSPSNTEPLLGDITTPTPNTSNSPALSLVQSNQNVVELKIDDTRRTSFGDIAGLEDVKKSIRMQIIEPFINPELFAKFGKKAGGGVFLYGPPGCGKTMMARAISTECKATFIPVGISDILGTYYGESERNLNYIFERARASKPCVLFFDELDALAFARAKNNSANARTLVNEFLNQLDGVGHNNDDILFLAASNMPWDVDQAMKRPGRFSRLVFVPPPDIEAKERMLQIKLQNLPVDNIDEKAFAKHLPNFSGADIDGLIESAKEMAIEYMLENGTQRNITQKDLDMALVNVVPSTEDWLRTGTNLVKYSGADRSYKTLEVYLRKNGWL